jgi:Ribosomal protein L7/L12 C-terminal domain
MENLSSGSGIGGFSGGGGGAAAAAAAAPVVAAEPVKEKDAFDIKLTVVDPKSKIKIIKEVRALTGLGLKEVIARINWCFRTDFFLSFLLFSNIFRRKIWSRKPPVSLSKVLRKKKLRRLKRFSRMLVQPSRSYNTSLFIRIVTDEDNELIHEHRQLTCSTLQINI